MAANDGANAGTRSLLPNSTLPLFASTLSEKYIFIADDGAVTPINEGLPDTTLPDVSENPTIAAKPSRKRRRRVRRLSEEGFRPRKLEFR